MINSTDQNHIVIVEAYEGFVEFLSDEPEERNCLQGLGLPVDEIAERLNSRITILCWDKWYDYEQNETWVSTPATRPLLQPDFGNRSVLFQSGRVKRIPIPARDPVYWLPFDEKGFSPRSYGLISDSGLLFFASYCLNREIQVFYRDDPFQAIIFSMWGGLGYVSQMSKTIQVPDMVDVPFIVLITDTSVNRQRANQEGIWTRHAIIRRQMEDVSLALADQVLVFGPRGKEIAFAGRLPESPPPVCAPRRIEVSLIDKISRASEQFSDIHSPLQYFLYEPQQAASGVLTALEALNLLVNKGVRIDRQVISAGPPMTFAPMKPREFVDYWSSRGFVRELERKHLWKWEREYPRFDYIYPVRLYLSSFDHLPNVWAELARGSFVLLSPAAAEGLAPGEMLPQEVLIQGDPVPEKVADHMEKILKTDIQELDKIRRVLCKRVVEAHRGVRRQRLIEDTTEVLHRLLQSSPKPQDLSRISLMFFDRRVPLRTLALQNIPPPLPTLKPKTKEGTLSVVVTCYEMGTMISEAVKSVWDSERKPDEVLLIDDGSQGSETLTEIRKLESYAAEDGLPLKVIRQQNRGLASARNAGLDAANGEFISFLDGDDIIEPEFYRIALRVLERYPRLGGVAAWALIFGNEIPDGFWNAPQPELPFLFIENSIIVPCMTRTELLRDIGGYDVRQRYNYEDWELGIRMLVSGWPIVTIPMHLTKYRVRRDSLYRSMTDVQNQVMRELLLNTHRETVSKFAVEIAMQLENQWKKLVYTRITSPVSIHSQYQYRGISFRKLLFQTTKRLFILLFVNRKNTKLL
ncbi:MAG: glycosyltransferase family 2 protein [Candidatus Scalindua sp.]|nr:glycosyltransferase family 2 protein [Candidatus Scalindua sp.]